MKIPKLKLIHSSVFYRYAGLILSTVIFLALISIILVVTIYSANSVDKNRGQSITVTQTSRVFNQFVQQATFLKDSLAEAQHQRPLLNELNKLYGIIDNGITVLNSGGVYTPLTGAEQIVTPVDTPEKAQHLDVVMRGWAGIGLKFKDYSDSFNSDLDSTVALEGFLAELNEKKGIFIKGVSSLDGVIRKVSRGHSNFSNKVSVTGISAAIIYFVIFTFYFLRRLIVADTEARVSREQTRDIMHTVNEGLFLLDEELTIGKEYSQELENILGVESIADRKLENVLASLVSENDLETAKDFIEQLFNRLVLEELITELNPLDRVRFFVSSGEAGQKAEKYLTFNFKRVYENDLIKRVLVSVSDITQSVNLELLLEKQHKQNEEQIELLSSILHIEPVVMRQFIDNVARCTDNINTILKSPQYTQSSLIDKVNHISREVHSLKGEASAIELHSYVSLLESFEDKLTTLKNQPSLTGKEFLSTAIDLEKLMSLTEKVSTLFERLEAGSLKALAGSVDLSNKSDSENPFVSDYFNDFAQKIAHRNNDKKVKVQVEGFEQIDLTQKNINILKDISLQLLRNAVVHGIEVPEKRVRDGKDKIGKIAIGLSEYENGNLLFTFKDDGQGIDFNALAEKASNDGWLRENSITKPSKKDLVKYMFSSGSSTLAQPSEDAGRGVGLDVIRDRVKQLGASKVSVTSTADKHTTFSVVFPK